MSCSTRSLVLIPAVLLYAASARAGDRYLSVALADLQYEDDARLVEVQSVAVPQRPFSSDVLAPWVVVPGAVAYLHPDAPGFWGVGSSARSITLRAPEGVELRGRLFVPEPATGTITVHAFRVGPATEGDAARRQYLADEWAHADHLLARGLPGAAWFRHVRDEARRALGDAAPTIEREAWFRGEADPLDLFSGARAVAENLDLDRALRPLAPGAAAIDVDTIPGVTTRPYDFHALVADAKPTLDPLARFVPADQHAAFFPSFKALTRVVDEFHERGTQALELFGASAEDHGVRDRYPEQMLLPMTTLGRLLGPAVIASAAVTGSDPFFVAGTDVVVLFECKEPAALETILAARQGEAVTRGAVRVDGEVLGAAYTGVVTPDRTVSSYRARFEDVVVVTNSFQALARIAQVARDSTLSLLAADEYVWFRQRYPRGDAEESALVVLSDATIRRWAGPRCRLADARRLQAAASMAEIHARNLDALVAGKPPRGESAAAADLPWSRDFVWGEHGVVSKTWGSLGNLTPASEVDVGRVSAEEKAAYERFRDAFQSRWRSFDPIAVRIGVTPKRTTVDATIVPLTLDTDYAEIRRWTEGASHGPRAGDPHEGTLLHVVTAISRTSELKDLGRDLLGPSATRFGADPLAWMGSTFALWAEKDPWWDDVRSARDDAFEDVDWYALPVVLRIDVKDPLGLAAFLTALRAFADESAPNLLRWENRTWKDASYVRVAPAPGMLPTEGDREPALYYVPFPDALLLTLREDLAQAAIERRQAATTGAAPATPAREWLGTSASARLDVDALDVFRLWTDRREEAAWSALPILDAWKQRFPAEDPVALHQRVWGVKLAPPDGGRYAWNEARGRVEASNYGAPGTRPADRPRGVLRGLTTVDLGLTFEGEGLRVRVALERGP